MTIEQELQETKELLRASVAKHDTLQKQCDEQAAMIRQMQDLLRRYLRGRYGAKTERFLGPVAGQTLITEFASLLLPEDLAAAQVAHGEPAPLPTPAVAAEPASADAKPSPVTAKRQPKRGAAWSAKHPELPVEEIVLQPVAADLIDGDGRAKVRIGQEISEQLIVTGPQAKIRRIVRPRYASASTGGERVVAALPLRITPKGGLADETIHRLVSQRFGWHCPFTRSIDQLSALGITLAKSTVNDACADWAAVFQPLTTAIRQQIWRAPAIFADHAVMRQQDHSKPGDCRRIPVFVATDGNQSWYYAPETLRNHRAGEVLHGYAGKVIGDDWSGWADDHPACNAHGRRPFAELQKDSSEARRICLLYAQVYAVEAQIREQARREAISGDALKALRVTIRQQSTRPIMVELRAEAERIAHTHPPRTTLGNGARYLIRLWPQLIAFIDDGDLLPDNNTAERALRGIALNRKNSLFLGHGENSPLRAAVAWTVLGSCRQLGIDETAYLNDITPTLLIRQQALMSGSMILPDLSSVTPLAWAERHQLGKIRAA